MSHEQVCLSIGEFGVQSESNQEFTDIIMLH